MESQFTLSNEESIKYGICVLKRFKIFENLKVAISALMKVQTEIIRKLKTNIKRNRKFINIFIIYIPCYFIIVLEAC